MVRMDSSSDGAFRTPKAAAGLGGAKTVVATGRQGLDLDAQPEDVRMSGF